MSNTNRFILFLYLAMVATLTAGVTVERLGEEALGPGVRSVEQVLDGGDVAVIATPLAKANEAYRGAYLVNGGEVVSLSAYEPVPNPFNWPWTAQALVGLSDGSEFWCESADKVSGVKVMPRIHYYGASGMVKPDSTEVNAQRIYLSDDDRAMLYCGTGESKLGYFSQQSFTQVGEGFLLANNSGLNPAVAADFQSLFYLAVNGSNTRLTLRKYDFASGQAEDLEDVGEREVLGLFNGQFLTDQHAVSSSADGRIIVYRFAETNEEKLRVALCDTFGAYTFKTLEGTVGATAPMISANGQFLAYRQNGRIYRYDLSQETTETISLESQLLVSSQPVISPNGRYVSYVDDEGGLWRADCGASIHLTEATQYFPTGTSDELGIVIDGATEETTISWNCVEAEGALPGTLYDVDGREVLPDESYSVASLPWSFLASGAGDSCQIRLVLDSGYSCDLTIVISDFLNLTASVNKEFARRFTSLYFPNAVNVGMLTNVMGSALNDIEYWNCNLNDKSWNKIATSDAPTNAIASQDGAALYWINSQGALYRNDAALLESGVTEVVISQDGHVAVVQNGALKFSDDNGVTFTQIADNCQNVRISADGATLAWVAGTKLMVRFRFGSEAAVTYAQNVSRLYGMSLDGLRLLYQATDGVFHGAMSTSASIAVDLTAIPASAENVVYSANGRRVMYTAVPEVAGAKASLYSLDVNIPGKSAPESATCLTPGVVRDVLRVSVSPSAQYAVVSSTADLVRGGSTTAENQGVNLFQWTDSQWTNKAPRSTSISLGEMNEDTEKEFSLYMTDDDDDAWIPKITAQPQHGTARILSPTKGKALYKLFYKPEADFYGEDEITMSFSDGTSVTTRTSTITVKPVNDPPVWDDEATPDSISMNALETASVTLVATDVDNSSEELVYSLADDTPGWACIQDNLLVLTPGLQAAGELTLTVQVSDGEYVVPKEITVTVSADEAEIPVAVLLDASKGPKNPETYADHLLVTVAGCWGDVPNGAWYALSLPGTADVAQLCNALGCAEIYLYDGKYLAVSNGTLPAGTGFWTKPTWNPEAVIALTPADAPAETERFVGPTWMDEDAVLPKEHFKAEASVWEQTADWMIGKGYFR